VKSGIFVRDVFNIIQTKQNQNKIKIESKQNQSKIKTKSKQSATKRNETKTFQEVES
jgi:hypothetical protein